MDFSTILQTEKVRAVVQSNMLERAFHDALFPRSLFRGEATPVDWPLNVGDSMIFSAPGLIPVDMRPTVPGTDPAPTTYPLEQWSAQLQQYSGTIDTHMPSSISAIIDLFMRNAHQLGMQASQTLNRKVRNVMFNAALSGWTVADGAQVAVTALRVKRLNGFTRARNPNLAAGSQVRYDLVSSSNPLAIQVYDTTGPAEVTRNVIAFTPDVPGDEQGPGVLTLSAAVSVSDRAYVISSDRTYMVRVGGGNKVDDVGALDLPTLADVRSAVAHFWEQNVPEHADGRFHAHIDPVSQSKLFSDAEFQRLMTALPDYYAYKQFALGEMLNTVFLRNSESPVPSTVVGGLTGTYDQRDPFVGELYNNGNASTGVKIHRILFSAQGGVMEYGQNMDALITEAGIMGAVAEPRIVNNGIEILSDRIQMIIRGPLNRLQDQVSTSWKFIGDWPVRTDGATGDTARYKRFLTIEHGE
jgi:hypothetical protein